MRDITIRGVVERSFVSSLSYAQLSFATFSAHEFVLEDLDEFLELARDPLVSPVDENELRRALAFLHEPAVASRLPALLVDAPHGPPMTGVDLPSPRAARTTIVSRLFEHTLTAQRFAAPIVVEEATRRRLVDGLKADRVFAAELSAKRVSADAAATAIRIFVIEGWQAAEAQLTLRALYAQEIPFSLSPEIRSETLRGVVREAKKFAVLPLMAGAFSGSTAVATGHYLTALEMAAAGGGSTIIIAGAAVVTDRLLAVLSRQ